VRRFSLFALLAVAIAGCKRQEAFEMLGTPPPTTLQKHWELPDFTFTERSGQKVMRGDLWVRSGSRTSSTPAVPDHAR
jgi:hypothetical protein